MIILNNYLEVGQVYSFWLQKKIHPFKCSSIHGMEVLTPALGRLRKDQSKFKSSLVYIVISRPDRAKQWNLPSRIKIYKQNQSKLLFQLNKSSATMTMFILHIPSYKYLCYWKKQDIHDYKYYSNYILIIMNKKFKHCQAYFMRQCTYVHSLIRWNSGAGLKFTAEIKHYVNGSFNSHT